MQETQAFLRVVARTALKHRQPRVLISVLSSNPAFTAEKSGFLDVLSCLGADPAHKIALVGDSMELGISHEYVALVGKQHGIQMRSFLNEAMAQRWLEAKE